VDVLLNDPLPKLKCYATD